MNFGELLKKAREEQQLTLEEVAEQLNLRVSLIRNLENGRIDRHTADVFTRGYVKSYAELLRIDTTEVLKVYDICAGNTASLQENKKKEDRQRRKQKKKKIALSLVFLVSFLCGIAVVLGIGFYMWIKYSEPVPLIDGPLPFAEEADTRSYNLYENVTIEEDPTEDQNIEQIATDIDETEIPNSNIAQEQPSQNVTDISDKKEVTSSLQVTEKIQPYVDVDITRDRNSHNHNLAEIVTAQNYVVHIEFSGDCWFDLRSGTARRKVTSKIFKASNIAEFTLINMPLRFKIGAPQNVSKLIINNYEIDLSKADPNRPYNLEIITK